MIGTDAATDLPKRMREMAARTAKTAKEQKGLDIQYAEAFRRVKLYIPPSPKDEA